MGLVQDTDAWMNSIENLEQFERVMLKNGIKPDEMVQRYAQYVILRIIASNRALRERLVLKGGNALDLIYQGDRSTKDIDFSDGGAFNEAWFYEHFTRAFRLNANDFGMALKIQRCRRNPAGENKTRATWEVNVGYAHRIRNPSAFRRMTSNEEYSAANIIEMDVSENEYVGEARERGLKGLRVASLNDIVAEKLRAILQQLERRRQRAQDVYDIAAIWKDEGKRGELNPEKVKLFHLEKCRIRDVQTGRERFDVAGVRERALSGYELLKETVRNDEFIEFEYAWECVKELVEWAGL